VWVTYCEGPALWSGGISSLLQDEGWELSGMMRISSKVLVDDIGVPVPVIKGAPGIWPNDPVCSR
jgi:hypothetical protein